MKILFLIPYPLGEAPSQRFRFEQYLDLLRARGYQLELKPFIGTKTWRSLYTSGHMFRKVWGVLVSFFKRMTHLVNASKSDLIFIHREATPVGPPIFEWLIAKVLNKRIIYDFDDAIWLPNTSTENQLVANLKWHQKVNSICKWSWKVSCGNQYLLDFASQFNTRGFLNPTTIDTEYRHLPIARKAEQRTLTIGWTGTHSTSRYLEIITPILKELEGQFTFVFLVISNQDPKLDLSSIEYVRWHESTEIEDLNRIDIGLMPLSDDQWSKGKCGFKALQFMALEIPVIASPVGVNRHIIDHGSNGYLAKDQSDWKECLIQLISDPTKRREVGQRGRKKVVEEFSVSSNRENFLSFFKD